MQEEGRGVEVEVKGGGSPRADSRRQNVSRLQRKSMFWCMRSTLQGIYSRDSGLGSQ